MQTNKRLSLRSSLFSRMKSALLIVLGILLGSMGATALVSAHGGDTTLIHACVKNNTGAIRVIGANGTCSSNETPLDWRIQGEPGPVGPQGPVGPSGPGIPSGAVMFFNQTSCPADWSPLTAGQGRYMVGVGPGQPVGDTVGTALSLGENRPAGRHFHALHDDFNDAFAAYSTTLQGILTGTQFQTTDSVPSYVFSASQNGRYFHYTQGATNAGAESGGVDGTPAPYIQLLVCQKN